MYVAMNRFRVIKAEADAFEQVWLGRRSTLHELEGFVEFHMLRGPEKADHVLYSSYTQWQSRENFLAWTTSEQFRSAHARAGGDRPLTLGHPEFEGFEVFQRISNPALAGAAQ